MRMTWRQFYWTWLSRTVLPSLSIGRAVGGSMTILAPLAYALASGLTSSLLGWSLPFYDLAWKASFSVVVCLAVGRMLLVPFWMHKEQDEKDAATLEAKESVLSKEIGHLKAEIGRLALALEGKQSTASLRRQIASLIEEGNRIAKHISTANRESITEVEALLTQWIQSASDWIDEHAPDFAAIFRSNRPDNAVRLSGNAYRAELYWHAENRIARLEQLRNEIGP